MAYGSTKEQAVARLSSALDMKRTSTLPLSVCLSLPLSLSLFLTLSISFSPHSTSGRADKAKEGKLCIIMSSLFPYSHVSVCASACVCACKCVCGFRFPCACVFLRQLLLTSLGPQEPQQTTATAKVETKNFAQFLCFSFISAQNCCVPRFLPELLPHPLHLCRTLIRLTHQNRAVKKERDKNNSKNTTEL